MQTNKRNWKFFAGGGAALLGVFIGTMIQKKRFENLMNQTKKNYQEIEKYIQEAETIHEEAKNVQKEIDDLLTKL